MIKNLIYISIISLLLHSCTKNNEIRIQYTGDVYISVKSINNTIKYSLEGLVLANYIIKNANIKTPTGSNIKMKEFGETGTKFSLIANSYSSKLPDIGKYQLTVNIKNKGERYISNTLSSETIKPSKINSAEVKDSMGKRFLLINFSQLEKADNYQIELLDSNDNILYISPLLETIYKKDENGKLFITKNQIVKINEPNSDNEDRFSRWVNSDQKLYDISKIKIKSILMEKNNELIQSISESDYTL
jgi:hypothetical protein